MLEKQCLRYNGSLQLKNSENGPDLAKTMLKKPLVDVFSWQIERKCVILQANNARICNRYVNKLFSKHYAKY